ncbi:30S ribosomal protein S18 [Candidatus Peregrinibacteria bacterium HGW-Peregrinibacteria-1]|jgi:small subunit ribosomal protein S18|nr:MAG: 30S ribosomal protein S18 [Candidatus Peregrinibacteria bacterium HGW-Peregrinibacteria-1]
MPTYNNRRCFFKENNINYIDYKNVPLLKKFITKYNKITPKYYSGTSLKYQKMLAKAIKNARYMGLIPFTK